MKDGAKEAITVGSLILSVSLIFALLNAHEALKYEKKHSKNYYDQGISDGFKQGAEWALRQSKEELPLPIPDADQVEPEKPKNYLKTRPRTK
jgi:hypothetical protein